MKAQDLEPDLASPISLLMNGLEEDLRSEKADSLYPGDPLSANMDSFLEKEAFAADTSAAVAKSDLVAVLITTARTLLGKMAV